VTINKFPAGRLGALALTGALLGACSSTPVATPAPPPSKAVPAPAPAAAVRPAPAPPAAPRPAPASTVATVTLPAYLDPKSEIYASRSVYFDFDATALKDDATSLLERHGKYLSTHPLVKIKIEGNTDERGSAEYNLALGQKRAEAVRKALMIAGAKDSQMEATSWGRERPKATGHDESAWAQNRRADLQYPRQ